MQKIIDLISEEFKERKNLGGNWEAYEVEEYLEEIQTSLINKVKAIEVIRSFKSDSEQLCECGGNERIALDCTMKLCKHPKYYNK